MVATSSSISQVNPLSTADQSIPTPDNSQQKIYWSFNRADDLNDNEIENDAPNATGQGIVSGTGNSITDKALQLATDSHIEGKINALDMRDSGISLSFWVKDNDVIPEMTLTQIAEDVLIGSQSETDANFQSKRFNAFVFNHQDDQLIIRLTRPNTSPDDGTNDNHATVLEYTVTLNGALNNGKEWHHVALVWNGEVNGTEGESIDLVVLIDGISFQVPAQGATTPVEGVSLTDSDRYQNSNGEDIIASRFTISATGITTPAAIDEVRLIKGIASPSLLRAFGSSRQTSGEPLIVWNGTHDFDLSTGENLIQGGSFDDASSLNFWDKSSSGVSLANSKAQLEDSAYISQEIPLEEGKRYIITFDVISPNKVCNLTQTENAWELVDPEEGLTTSLRWCNGPDVYNDNVIVARQDGEIEEMMGVASSVCTVLTEDLVPDDEIEYRLEFDLFLNEDWEPDSVTEPTGAWYDIGFCYFHAPDAWLPEGTDPNYREEMFENLTFEYLEDARKAHYISEPFTFTILDPPYCLYIKIISGIWNLQNITLTSSIPTPGYLTYGFGSDSTDFSNPFGDIKIDESVNVQTIKHSFVASSDSNYFFIQLINGKVNIDNVSVTLATSYPNTSPIPEIEDYKAQFTSDITLSNGAFNLENGNCVETNPDDLFIDDALTVESWFKPDDGQSQLPLFDVDLGYHFDLGNINFHTQQGLSVIHDNDEFQVNIIAKDVARHEISTEQELRTALNAVLNNTIHNQKFQIIVSADITLSSSLPSLVGSEFVTEALTLAPGTELTITSESSPPKSISGSTNYQILAIDADDAIINFKNLELRDGFAKGEPSEPGGGAGLGAGGALFIAGGSVNIEGVIFTDNHAQGGTAESSAGGRGGDVVKEEEHGDNETNDGGQGGKGGQFNQTGDTTYYATLAPAGAGGEGGKDANLNERNDNLSNQFGEWGGDGAFGSGGGQGGGGQGGVTDGNNDYGGNGGNGGAGGFGAGGGGGGGAGGNATTHNIESDGGSGGIAGNYGQNGQNGSGRGAGKDEEYGAPGGHGGHGAGLGGAIFVADSSNLTGISRRPRIKISGDCRFQGNQVTSGGEDAEALGKAIFFESEFFFCDNSNDEENVFPSNGIETTEVIVHSINNLQDLANAVEAVNSDEVDHEIVLHSDIILSPTMNNILIQNVPSGKSSGGLIIRSEEGERYSISGDDQYQIITMDNFGGYLELYNLELKNGLAKGGDGVDGGGSGLGAGGALFINSGNVVVDSVTFSANQAKGGDAISKGSNVGDRVNPCSPAGDGGRMNANTTLNLGASGQGGSLPSGSMQDGENGHAGDWGTGGGAGSAPRYSQLHNDGDETCYAGSGGAGGFGAGGGAGAANATISKEYYGSGNQVHSDYYRGIPGAGGSAGEYGTSGTDGTTGPDNNVGEGNPGIGGAGAGLGGAIFVRNASSSRPGENDTFLSIKESIFLGNSVHGGIVNNNSSKGEAFGNAIFTESRKDDPIDNQGEDNPIDYRLELGLLNTESPKQAILASSRSIESPVDSITYTFASALTSDWHHVATSFANGGVPQVYLDGIPLPRTDDNEAIEVNQDGGFAPSTEAVVRWGHIKNIEGSFQGDVNGFRLFDRSLSSSEIYSSASAAALQRLIIQLDDSQDATDTAQSLDQFSSSAYFNTTWITLTKGSDLTLVNGPTGKDWNEIKASLGDGVVIELVGTGNGNTVGYTSDTTLSTYTPEELVNALENILPGGLSAAEMFVCATHFISPDGFEQENLSQEEELTPETEPATLRFSTALMEADLTESVNYGPLRRFSENNIELKQTTDTWVLYEDVNEGNPVLVEYTHQDFGMSSLISVGIKVHGLVKKSLSLKEWVESRRIDLEIDPVELIDFRQLPDDFEDVNTKKIKKNSLESTKARSKTARFYDIFKVENPEGMKVFVKGTKLLSPGIKLPESGLKLASNALIGSFLGSGTSVANDLYKHCDQGSPIFKNNKNKKFKSKLIKGTKFSLKYYAFPVLGGLGTVFASVRLFKTGSTYDIVKGSLKLVSGLVLPIAEATFSALVAAEVTSAAYAGPFAIGVLAAALVIDIALIIADQIRKAVQRHKLVEKALDFTSEDYIQLVNDLKGSLSNVDDLYISGRFSGAPDDDRTNTDQLTGVTSWLYQALDSSCKLSQAQTIENIINRLNEDDKNLPVENFIEKLNNGELSYAIDQAVQIDFTTIYEEWTNDGGIPVIDIDLISDSNILFRIDNLRECLQQFVGERLDDGGTQSADAGEVFTAGEALALDGFNIEAYSRNIAVYGTDTSSREEGGIREEIKTGKGNDTILLGLGEFHVETGEGNNTIYLSSAFKDVLDANDQSKYYLDAGDIPDASISMQLQKDSDTLIIDGSAHINLTLMPDKNLADDGTPKQAVFFQNGQELAAQKPLLVSSVENVYGSDEDDTLVSNAQKCSNLTANGGSNILVTGYGTATEDGAPNLINSLKGGTGSDKIYGSHAGGQGYNSLLGGDGGNNLLIADEGFNILHGGPGNDILVAEIYPDKTTDNIFIFGFGDGEDQIEKGLNVIEVYCTSSDGDFTDGIHFIYDLRNNDGYNYNGPIIDSPDKVRDILQFSEGVTASNLRVSVGKDPQDRTEPLSETPITNEVTFSLVVDDTRTFDALIGDDRTKPNLQTGDSITIKGNWSGNSNLNHRIKTLRFGDGSSLEIARINHWNTTGTVNDNTVTLEGATFFQGFSGNDTITANGGNNVILPGSGHNTININGDNDQVLINRNPLSRDTINIQEDSRNMTLALDGSIRLRDLGFALNGVDLTLTIGQGGNLTQATQIVEITNAKNNLLLRFGTGFTLDLTHFNFSEIYQGNNEDNTLRANGSAILSGGFGHDTLEGGLTGPSIFIGGAGNNIIKGSQDNSRDLYILQDHGGIETIAGGGGSFSISTVQDKTVLMVGTNAEFLGSAILKRDDIWFATQETVTGLDDNIDRDKLPDELKNLQSGQLLIWIRGDNNGAVITDWQKWDDSNHLVVTNQYEGAFEITKSDIEILLKIMNRYVDLESNTYSPWNPDLGNDEDTFALNQDLSELLLAMWKPTSSIMSVN